jgi:hypothetical protein
LARMAGWMRGSAAARDRGLQLLYWTGWAAILGYGAHLFLRWHNAPGILPSSLDAGWWTGADQSRYLQAAQALSEGDLSASRQWYEPGYALLAAPFAGFSRHDPFLVPNLVCYLLSGLLSGLLARRLLAMGRWGAPLGTLAFVVATTWSVPALAIWATPWTTTAVAVLILGALVAALAFADRPRPLACFAAALFAGAIAAFRPSDVAVAGGPAALVVFWTLARARLARRAMAACGLAGLAGASAGLGSALALHVAIWGWALGPYLVESANVGFAPALIPLRWVMLFLGPRPLLTEGIGMAALFPWIIPGVAGMAASLVAPGRTGRVVHLTVIGAAVLHCLMLLAYRDLHPTGLWHYANYHYFKWLIPLCAIYSLVLLRGLLDANRRLPMLATAALTTVALFCWRPSLSTTGGMQAERTGPHQVTLQAGTRSLRDALLIAASGPRDDIVMGDYGGEGPDRHYSANADFKAYSRPGGLLLVPLRELPAGLRIDMPPAVTLAGEPVGVTQQIVFGLPCWGGPCPGGPMLPPPTLPIGATLAMDRGADNAVSGSWELAEPTGRWLQGPDAALTLRLVGWQPGQGLLLTLRAMTNPPPRRGRPVRIQLSANGHALEVWQPPYGRSSETAMAIPAADIGPGGVLTIGWHVEGRHRPDFEGEAILGDRTIFLNTLRLDPLGPG